jgi:hypothetical protein
MKNRRSGPASGRPAHIQAPLAKLLFCKVCGQAMSSHIRDWDYTYKKLADGTKARYRIQHGKVKIKYICGGMQSYPDLHRCRKPEYVRNERIFPIVWQKLYDGLAHPEQITVGIRKLIQQLENADEQADLKTIEQRLSKIENKMLSYAEQRADGSITAEQQHKLNAPLEDEKQSLLEEKVVLTAKTQKIDEARQMLAYIEPVARKLAERVADLDNSEKAIFVHATCQKVWLDADNEPEVELSLPGLEAFLANGLPGSPDSKPSPLRESECLNDSPSEESDKTIDSRHWDLSNTARCRDVEYVPILPLAQVLEQYPMRW